MMNYQSCRTFFREMQHALSSAPGQWQLHSAADDVSTSSASQRLHPRPLHPFAVPRSLTAVHLPSNSSSPCRTTRCMAAAKLQRASPALPAVAWQCGVKREVKPALVLCSSADDKRDQQRTYAKDSELECECQQRNGREMAPEIGRGSSGSCSNESAVYSALRMQRPSDICPDGMQRDAGGGVGGVVARGAEELAVKRGSNVRRRRGLLMAAMASPLLLCPTSAHAGDDVCQQCRGSGKVPCSLCFGSGQWVSGIQNGQQVTDTCPQCEGRGQLKCVLCLGTGLRNTAGLLRGPAVTEGHLRVRVDGSIEILDCDYFPATKGTDCLNGGPLGEEDSNLLTEERAYTAPRGQLYPRPDL